MRNSNYLSFNSISELLRELDNAPKISGRMDCSEDTDRGSDWCDTKTYQEARDFMQYGKVFDGIETNLNKYKTNGCAEKNKMFLDVVGYQPVVPLAIQCIPESMINKRKTINNKIINIIYECSAPHYVKSSEIMRTTTELMKNIIKLEKDGYRVNLYIGEYNDNDRGYGFLVRLKTDGEMLNIKKLCFPLVSTSFLRRIGFRIKERLFKDWIGGGYGHAVLNQEEMKKFVQNTLRLKHYECWTYEGKKFSV